MQRYFVKANNIINDTIFITGDDVKHINKVMRNKTGDKIICINEDTGDTYISQITAIETSQISLKIISKESINNEPNISITIYQGLTKSDKFEWIIQKGTEIGITNFVPVKMKNAVVKWESDRGDKKLERWQKIAKEAAEQSKRNKVPKIHNVINFKEVINTVNTKHTLTLLAYEKSELSQGLLITLKQYPKCNNIGLIIGPEGGFCDEEIRLAKDNNIKIINLGPRTLRTETAGLVAATGIMFFHQQLGE